MSDTPVYIAGVGLLLRCSHPPFFPSRHSRVPCCCRRDRRSRRSILLPLRHDADGIVASTRGDQTGVR